MASGLMPARLQPGRAAAPPCPRACSAMPALRAGEDAVHLLAARSRSARSMREAEVGGDRLGEEAVGRGGQHAPGSPAVAVARRPAPARRRRCAAAPAPRRSARAAAPRPRARAAAQRRRVEGAELGRPDRGRRGSARPRLRLRASKLARSSTPSSIRNSHHSTSLSPSSSVPSRSNSVRLVAHARAAQVPGLGPDEGPDAVAPQGAAHAGVAAPRPGQAGADPVAAVPVDAAGVDARQDGFARARSSRRVDAGGEAVAGVVHERQRLVVAGDLLDADDRAEALLAHQLHAVVDVGEHGRREPVARARPSAARRAQRAPLATASSTWASSTSSCGARVRGPM